MTVGTSRLVLPVLATAVLSSMLTAVWMSPGPDSAPPVEPTAVDPYGLEALTERLDALIDTLSIRSARTTPEAPTPALPVDRTPLEGDEAGQAIAASLEDIRALLQVQAYRSQVQSGGLTGVSMRYPDANWLALQNLQARLGQNREPVSRSQMLLTPPEVLELYGRPTKVLARNNDTRWQYQKTLANDTRVSLTFYFRDGYIYQVR